MGLSARDLRPIQRGLVCFVVIQISLSPRPSFSMRRNVADANRRRTIPTRKNTSARTPEGTRAHTSVATPAPSSHQPCLWVNSGTRARRIRENCCRFVVILSPHELDGLAHSHALFIIVIYQSTWKYANRTCKYPWYSRSVLDHTGNRSAVTMGLARCLPDSTCPRTVQSLPANRPTPGVT